MYNYLNNAAQKPPIFVIQILAMAKKKAEEALARELYMNTDKSLKEIAEIVKVSQNTLGEWSKSGQWETLKTARSITKPQLVSNYYSAIKQIQDNIAARKVPDNVPTPKEADVLAKIHAQVQRLESKSSLSDYIEAYEGFLKFMLNKKPDLAREIAPYLYEFCEVKAAEFDEK